MLLYFFIQEKLKTQQYKDQYEVQNTEVTETIHRLHETQQENLSPAFHMVCKHLVVEEE